MSAHIKTQNWYASVSPSWNVDSIRERGELHVNLVTADDKIRHQRMHGVVQPGFSFTSSIVGYHHLGDDNAWFQETTKNLYFFRGI